MALLGKKDKHDESLFTLIGEIPALVRNLVVAEINSAKAWLAKTAKDYGIGVVWFIAALFVLFWAVPVFGTAAIAGLATVWPVWLSALVIGFAMIIIVGAMGICLDSAFERFRARLVRWSEPTFNMPLSFS